MNTIELFCGTKSFSKYAQKLNYNTFTIDNNAEFNPDAVFDLLKPLTPEIKYKLDNAKVVWMSPPCTTFSMASGGKHWGKDRRPKTKDALMGKELLLFCLKIADYCDKNDKIYFIENPRARARWFMPEDTRQTVWYCQYGETRAKLTDIWTNLKGWTGKQCFNGNPNCHHERAPRGSISGTQKIKGSKDRGKIPEQLFEELFEYMRLKDD